MSSDVIQVLNQHPNASPSAVAGEVANGSSAGSKADLSFRVGISEDSNKRWRRAMEDAHAFVYDFAGVHGQGFFGIFDGHAGKDAAEWCGQNFHKVRQIQHFLAKQLHFTTVWQPSDLLLCCAPNSLSSRHLSSIQTNPYQIRST